MTQIIDKIPRSVQLPFNFFESFAMFNVGHRISSAVAIAALVWLGPTAYAATCPSPTISGYGVITLGGAASGSTCYAYGSPPTNIGGSAHDPMIAAGFTLLGDLNTADTNNLLTIAITGTGTGTFTIGSTSEYTDFIFAIKDGNLNGLQWGAFQLVPGDLTGTWSLQNKNGTYHDFSDASLYGRAQGGGTIGTTPIPGGLWLFGTVLAGSVGFNKWRNRGKSDKADVARMVIANAALTYQSGSGRTPHSQPDQNT